MYPVIGVAVCGLENGRQFIPQSYIHAIEASGGIPAVIPRTSSDAVFQAFLRMCDGFLFCGGDDITPWIFGEELLVDRGRTSVTCDIFHLTLMHHVLDARLPLLAICRGMQVLNVALGGDIYQDITLRPVVSLNHMQCSEDREDVSHKVIFSANSILYNICGEYAYTNSFHHQCLHNTGTNLRITGIASDGVIESVEWSAHPFVVGVQWHPECMYDSCAHMQELFHRFIEQCRHSRVIQLL